MQIGRIELMILKVEKGQISKGKLYLKKKKKPKRILHGYMRSG